jgi:hypothetical protein
MQQAYDETGEQSNKLSASNRNLYIYYNMYRMLHPFGVIFRRLPRNSSMKTKITECNCYNWCEYTHDKSYSQYLRI